jgi:hypothetical protein
MEKKVQKALNYVALGVMTATAALSLAFIAHYDFGLSRQEIRTSALVVAAVVASLVAVEYFGRNLPSPSDRPR